MARGRMVSQSIALDPEFNGMSASAQLMFVRTIPFLDRDGLILGNAVALWAKVAPLITEIQPLMPDIIQEWIDSKLVVAYVDRGREVLWFKGFRKNQVGMRYDREAPSEFNPPPGYDYGDKDFVKVPSDPTPPQGNNGADKQCRTNSGPTPEPLRTNSPPIEVKAKQSKGTAPDPRPDMVEQDEGTDALALLRLAYDSIGSFCPPSQTEKGKRNIKIASLLLEQFGYKMCAETIPKLQERHHQKIRDGDKRGINAPIAYLATLMQDEHPTANGEVDFILEDLL